MSSSGYDTSLIFLFQLSHGTLNDSIPIISTPKHPIKANSLCGTDSDMYRLVLKAFLFLFIQLLRHAWSLIAVAFNYYERLLSKLFICWVIELLLLCVMQNKPAHKFTSAKPSVIFVSSDLLMHRKMFLCCKKFPCVLYWCWITL